MQVFVLVHVKVVEGVSVGWMTITQCEVNSNGKLNLTASEDIFQESVTSVEIASLKCDFLIFSLVQRVFQLVLLELSNVAAEITEISVLA